MKSILLILHGMLSWMAHRFHACALGIVTILLALSTPSCSYSPHYIDGRACDSTSERHGYPSCLPPSSALFCERNTPKNQGLDVVGQNKALIGQSILFPSKYTLGPAQPECPPSPETLFTREEKRIVKEGAHDVGKQFGTAMFHCDSALESLTNMTDHHLAVHQQANPKAVELVLSNCQHDLEAIPAIPAYESAELRGIAEKAFEEGVGAGISEAFHRILAIELAVTVIEVAVIEAAPLIHVAVTELAGARGIRRALDALREMPVFLPLTVDGAGVMVKIGRAAKGSARVLAQNMKKAKRALRLPGEFTHHIVAIGDKRAKQALEILERFGIHVDDEVNGVFLPGFKTSPNPLGKVVHGNLHTTAYFRAVEKRLLDAKTRAQAEEILRKIAHQLEHGVIPR